ncbi:MAG: D-tyrosyl-tRNA(Tyr) deacylase [Chloroflexi bacterium]|nr:D-tyrosyl-tRNA(Tyr) deacylase [Chloroflexota bacterium]
MRALIQRVLKASVMVNNKLVSRIDTGLLIFLGIKNDDSSKDVEYLANKITNLRIFANETSDNFEKSLIESKKEILVVSQFTLYAMTKKGRRPSFIESAKSDYALAKYEEFINELKKSDLEIQEGIFGAKMHVKIINDGPVTLMLDSRL